VNPSCDAPDRDDECETHPRPVQFGDDEGDGEDCTENLEDCFSETLHQDTSLSRFRVSDTLPQAQIKAVLDTDQCRFSHFRSSETSESVRPRRISSRILSSVFFTSIARRATS